MAQIPADDTAPLLTSRETRFAALALAVLVALQVIYAVIADLRTDEAYYWTLSKEYVLSYLDHPPMVGWLVRFGTAIFGDTSFGARFGGLLAMWIAWVILADIVWRVTRNRGAVVVAVLMPFAAPEYGLFASRIVPDAGLIASSLAMVWSLVRLTESNDGRWWLAAGLFGGLALLSKYTAIFLAPAILAFLLVPLWRARWLRSPYPWLAIIVALLVFSPVLIWNAQHDWASFKFQFIRAGADHGLSARTLGDFLGLQLALVGPVLFPVALAGTVLLAWRGYRRQHPAFILVSTCALVPFAYFLWKSLSLRIGDTWPLVIWPFAFAAAAINLDAMGGEGRSGWIARTAAPWAKVALVLGFVLNVAIFYYYSVSNFAVAARQDPVAKEAGYGEIAQRAKAAADKAGATWIATLDYRIYAELRWHLKDSIPVVQVNERSRFIGFTDTASAAMRSGIGLYVDSAPNDGNVMEKETPAVFRVVGQADRTWRGVVIEPFVFKTVTGWTPDLSPPPDSPFYRWRLLN
ncbi:glycosyltransferase family 39 protein [Bradyrhizobium sp. G127]|uniref:glycosyltransferase family 39 protein n=1 Tax=Bradyrhizobium sp. G127 TaxID=2904800 RepID=UPI001F47C618|nr:glycosyltransferase family 39 protein [Bradyrhizobium sp. G127]MCF2522317.1 glycosyltransferase family 39 protein [Bradyrhizobium sp. G127]